jgi:hypothetical protein
MVDGQYWIHTKVPLTHATEVQSFFHGPQDAELDEVPAYAFWIENHDEWRNYIDLVYFFYYPYNRGKTMLNSVWGNHVGDWEHVTVRIDPRTLEATELALSAHPGGETISWADIGKTPDRVLRMGITRELLDTGRSRIQPDRGPSARRHPRPRPHEQFGRPGRLGYLAQFPALRLVHQTWPRRRSVAGVDEHGLFRCRIGSDLSLGQQGGYVRALHRAVVLGFPGRLPARERSHRTGFEVDGLEHGRPPLRPGRPWITRAIADDYEHRGAI